MSYQIHQPARQGLVPGHGPGIHMPITGYGLSDLTEDQTAGVSFLSSLTTPLRGKFPNWDRILQSDIPMLETSIATYISQAAGWTPLDVQATAQNIFAILCPVNISGREHIKTIANVGIGWRLNGDTLNAAGQAIGQAVSNYRAAKPTGVSGVVGSVGTVISSLFGNPIMIAILGLGVFLVYKAVKARKPVPTRARSNPRVKGRGYRLGYYRTAPSKTFHLPDNERRKNLKKGETVKLTFHNRDRAERMWVKVTAIPRSGEYAGKLMNQSITETFPKWGSTVRFSWYNVIATER